MGFISKSIFEGILSLVLQNRFADIQQLSDPQNEAFFGILNPEDVFAILPTGHGKSIIFQCLFYCSKSHMIGGLNIFGDVSGVSMFT